MLFATPDNVFALLHIGVLGLGALTCGDVVGKALVWGYSIRESSTSPLLKKELQERLTSLWLPSLIGLVLFLLGIYALLAVIVIVVSVLVAYSIYYFTH